MGSSLEAATNREFPRRYQRNIKGHWPPFIKIWFGRRAIANPARSELAEPVASLHTQRHTDRAQELRQMLREASPYMSGRDTPGHRLSC